MTLPLSQDQRDLLALHLVPGIGPRLTAALLERFGSASAVRQASAAELRQVPYLGETLADKVAAALRTTDVDAELAKMARHNVTLRILHTPEYPAALATISSPPHLLYCRGNIEARDARAVAIVGSRACTSYGKRMAERMASELARAGYTIVSGLARGIDGVAHRGALQAGGRTIAVLAGGLSRIYPPEHKELAAEVEGAGALLSEAVMDQEPLPTMFPARNRIISGLSRAVVLVEAAEKSGALITAKHAVEQGRPVFAMPGPVEGGSSGGTNALIRQGAILCRGAVDVLEELDGLAGMRPAADKPPPPALDAVEQRLWDFLASEPKHLDDIVQTLGLSVPKLSGMLLTLEMKKIVRRLPGNRYERA
ncbi:MAG TPA: DNA-processing protein DprA [Gemmataceae bacterium]|nr:DNA-processing protein DprA [Gemmataceae bacterium]